MVLRNRDAHGLEQKQTWHPKSLGVAIFYGQSFRVPVWGSLFSDKPSWHRTEKNLSCFLYDWLMGGSNYGLWSTVIFFKGIFVRPQIINWSSLIKYFMCVWWEHPCNWFKTPGVWGSPPSNRKPGEMFWIYKNDLRARSWGSFSIIYIILSRARDSA